MASHKYTIIIPTYTGADSIDNILNNLLSQTVTNFNVLVVIDGVNPKLLCVVKSYTKKFVKLKISFEILQLTVNMGRFTARLQGAQKSQTEVLVFIDDRVTIQQNFLESIYDINEDVIIPVVSEKRGQTVIGEFMSFIRRYIYLPVTEPYYITNENFDKSAKGTTCLIIKREIFIKACSKMLMDDHEVSHNSSDDTKLLRKVIDMKNKILKTNISVQYVPRNKLYDELFHSFNRGPKFVDYYLEPGTRYFPYLILFYLVLLACIAMLVISPILMLTLILSSIVLWAITIVVLAGIRDVARIFIGGLLTCISFGLGLIKGLIIKTWGILN